MDGPKGSKRGREGTSLFNQITLEAKTDAGKYLEELIRAQIDIYTNRVRPHLTSGAQGFRVSTGITRPMRQRTLARCWTPSEWSGISTRIISLDKLKPVDKFPSSSTFPTTKEDRIAYRLADSGRLGRPMTL